MKADLLIIGAGPGGYETALTAARQGKSVILFNGDKLGGTCLNEGCIPTKCLCKNAEVVSLFKEGDKFGIDDFTFTLDYNKVIERKREVVENLRKGVETLLTQAKVTVVNSKAVFKNAKTVIADGEEYEGDRIIIATGSVSKSLQIPGHDLKCVMDSSTILELEYIPATLTIIGGGVIGMEFASIFHQLGSKVTVIEFMKQILPPFDSDIAKRLKQSLTKKGINIITGASAKEIRQNEFYEIEVVYEVKGKEEKIVSSDLLMAVGRTPRVEGLNLEAAGVNYSPKGIPVDEFMQTNVQGIFAIGDVNGKMMLAHVASAQGERALNVINGVSDKLRFDLIPSAVFTVPECGMVGKTEEQCKEEKLEIMVGTSFFRANGKAMALGETDGICKLIFKKEDGLLIGAHIMGVEAADLAQQCADLMNRNTTLKEFKDIIFGHPTVSEVLIAAVRSVK
ncbi:MAG: dihydrolipoyl dehydrogenase [Muribaculaceae bacterium]|nr:dihydrolipoyl dehydrogenase [Muribaculaceae bacterium]